MEKYQKVTRYLKRKKRELQKKINSAGLTLEEVGMYIIIRETEQAVEEEF
jgi:hypothetical protein